MNKNKDTIEKVILNYKIRNVYDFGDKILNINENPLYNNFLEKITCITPDGVNYIDCDNINYTKIYAFSELIKVFTLSIEKVVELINKHKLYKLCDLSGKRDILLDIDNQTSFGYEYDGLLYYLNEKSFSEKYFKILELLELDQYLNNKNKAISLRERLYNYRDKNKKVTKDLNSILVLFNYYEVFDPLRMNYDEDDYNWDYSILKSVDLNRSYWDTIDYFVDYDVKQKIIDKINKLTETEEDIFQHKLNPIFDDNEKKVLSVMDKENKETKSDLYLKEYKLLQDLNTKSNEKENVNLLKELNLESIKNNFGNIFVDIIKDLSTLYSRRCALDCSNKPNTYINSIAFYFNEIIIILTKKGRMFYVGLFVIFISFMLYFIEISN